jgi:putative chitinase
MMVVWPSRFPNLASTNGFAHNPEALANKVYGGRMGNDRPGDGFKYRGRGYIQITGKDGYKEVGARAALDLVGHPEFALDPQHCLRIACAFWQWKKVNVECDQGDFVGATKRINGGTVGLQDRFDWLDKVQSIVPWPLSAAGGAAPVSDELQLSTARLKAIQIKLQGLGLYDGSIDGLFGRKSRSGLKVFQAENGLPKTGKLDQATVDKLGV